MNRSSLSKSLSSIDAFLQKVGAAEKVAAEPLSEPGSQGGETEHPVKNVDDRLEKVTEGSRSKENTEDVKKDQGAVSVDSIPNAKAAASRLAKKATGSAVQTPGSAEDDHVQIGLKAAPTGEDPANETSKAKGGKDDPGSSHPARTDNDSLDGHKYASMSFEKLASVVRDLGNDLCCAIASLSDAQLTPTTSAASPAQKTAQVSTPTQSVDPALAQQVGYEMAALMNNTLDKKAADALVEATLHEVIKQAAEDADHFIEYARNFLAKQAEGPPPGAGGPPPGAGDGDGDEAGMMAALGGGAGGPPPGAGGPPPGAEGGEGGGIGVEQLAEILEQLGITPEMLMQAQQAMAGGAGGPGGPPPGAGGPPPGAEGPPPGAGGPPPDVGGPPPPGAGGPPKAAAAKAATMDESQSVITELLKRSKRKAA